MTGYKCPSCGRGLVTTTTEHNFVTSIEGVSLTIPSVTLDKCDACDERFFSANELRRWKELAQQQSAWVPLEPEEVSALRTALGVTVTSFSRLTGATRQSVYHWEDKSRKVSQQKSIDFLLRLIRDGLKGYVDVIACLAEYGRVDARVMTCCPNRNSGRSSRPLSDYSKALNLADDAQVRRIPSLLRAVS